MRTLCLDCALSHIDALTQGQRRDFLVTLATGDTRICVYPRNCDNIARTGHDTAGPRVLTDLPASAQSEAR